MAKQLPIWRAPGVEPPENLKTNGWQAGMKPAAEHMNWLLNQLSVLAAEAGVTVEDLLTSDSAVNALSAKQGKLLKSLIDGKANTSHTHTISDVSGLQSALNGKAASSHTHTISQITGLQTALDNKANNTDLSNVQQTVTQHLAQNNQNAHLISNIAGLTDALDNISVDTSSLQANIIDLAIELEITKAAELTGVDSNIFIETFQNLDDLTLLNGAYNSVSKRIEV